jgi:NTP pyrophosphatase (non-canonical NTP hydrolase)
MEIKELIKEAHANAKKHGFWEDWREGAWLNIDKNTVASMENNAISTRLMLIVGEVAEAQEGLRHNDMCNFQEEIADVCIRIFDLCGGLGIDLEEEIHKKMEKNKERPWKHGKAF